MRNRPCIECGRIDHTYDNCPKLKRIYGGKNIKDKPSARVSRVMERLSRNRWLPPDEVDKLSDHFAKLSSCGSHWTVSQRAVDDLCRVVGMIRGKPPAYPGESVYPRILSIVKNRGKDDTKTMISIINCYKWGFYENHR